MTVLSLIIFGGAFLAVTALFAITAHRLDRKTHQLEVMTENRDYWYEQGRHAHAWEYAAFALYLEKPKLSEARPIADDFVPSLLPDNQLFVEAA